ncbi:MAG: hypothetical protein R3E53_20315 [Myxococcota bacterium]
MDEARDRNEPASLVERGRRLVRASADIPLEALEFLGLPLMRTGGARAGRSRQMVVPMDAPPPRSATCTSLGSGSKKGSWRIRRSSPG